MDLFRHAGCAHLWLLAGTLVACVPDADLSDERSSTNAPGAAPTPGSPAAQVATKPAADDGMPPEIKSLRVEEGACVHALALPSKTATVSFAFRVGGSVVTVPGRLRSDGWMETFNALPSLMTVTSGEVIALAVDAQGRMATSAGQPFTTPRIRPPLVITEILANPAGSEYTQEYVEIFNYSDAPIPLLGLAIEDSEGSDPLPELTLPPRTYAIVVAEAWSESAGPDPPPAAGSLVVRVPGRLGRDGLSNGGESVTLREGKGAVVSVYGGFVDMSATAWNGRSAHRVPPDDPCDQRYLWTERPQPPSPGW